MHKALLIQAARAGKHIFTEKMLAHDTRGAEAIAAAVREAGVTFTISLPEKSSPTVLYAKQQIESGVLGKITGARFRRSHAGVSDDWLPEYWYDLEASAGGALMDLGAHPIYIMADFFGMPERLTALMSAPYGSPSDENTIALAEFEGGLLATMETAFVTKGVPDLLEVYGTEGSVFVRRGEVVLSIGREWQVIPASELPPGAPSPLMQFVRAIEQGEAAPKGLGLEDAILMTRICEAAYLSEYHWKTVSL